VTVSALYIPPQSNSTTAPPHHRITALQYMRKSRQISLGRNTPSGPKSQTQQEQQPNKSI